MEPARGGQAGREEKGKENEQDRTALLLACFLFYPRVFFPLPTSRCTCFSLFFVLSCSFSFPFSSLPACPPPGRLHCLFFLLWLSCFLVEAPSFCCFVAPAPPRAGSTAFSSYVSFACFGFPPAPSGPPRPLLPPPAPLPPPPPAPLLLIFFCLVGPAASHFPTLPSCPALACFFHCLLPGALLLACFLFYPARFLSPFLLSRPAPPGPAPPPLLLMLRSRACFFSVFALWLSCCLVEAPSFCCFVAPAASDLLSAILFFVLVFAA